MKPAFQPLLLLLVGAAVLRVSLFDDIALRYVKAGLQPFLVATGLVLLVLGAIGALRDGPLLAARRTAPDAPPPGAAPLPEEQGHDGHDHGEGPRIAWLLVPPALLLLMFAPPALGSYTAARDNPKIVADYDRFEPLPATGPVPLSLTEFTARLQQQREQSVKGRTVVLTGFVTPRGNGTWDLTRLVVSCCAADSQSLSLTVHGIEAPPADTWVVVTGTWHPVGTLGTTSAALAVDAKTLRRVPEPQDPYLDRAPDLPRPLPGSGGGTPGSRSPETGEPEPVSP